MMADRDPKDIQQAAKVFKALSHPGRLEIACRLVDGPSTQTALVEAMALPQSSVARLLNPLRDLELVKGERQGQEVRLSVGDPVVSLLVETVCDWLHGGGEESAAGGKN
jgi:DNA-binding transcriptional ArsR family regulator